MSDDLNSSVKSVEKTEENLRDLVLTHTSRVENISKLLREEREMMNQERRSMQELMGLLKDTINTLDARETEARTRIAALMRVDQRLSSNLDRLAILVRELRDHKG